MIKYQQQNKQTLNLFNSLLDKINVGLLRKVAMVHLLVSNQRQYFKRVCIYICICSDMTGTILNKHISINNASYNDGWPLCRLW